MVIIFFELINHRNVLKIITYNLSNVSLFLDYLHAKDKQEVQMQLKMR